MINKDSKKLIELVKYALDPESIKILEESYARNGNTSYLTLFKSKAVVSYFETGEPEAYWRNMRRVGELQIELFKRYEAGERISESYVQTSTMSEFIQSLSGGCFDLIPEINVYFNTIKAEKNLYLFKMLRGLLAKKDISIEYENAREYYCNKKRWSINLTEVIGALFRKDSEEFKVAFNCLMKGYKAKYKYEIPEYKLIAIFPLGLLQLARHYGMDVSIEHALIPKDLLVPVNQPCA